MLARVLWIAVAHHLDRHHGRDDVRSARALNARCGTRAVWGQSLGQALADCDLALKLHPDEASYLDSCGRVRLRRGGRGVAELRKGMQDDDEGQADIAAALRLQPQIASEARQRNIGP
jgi:hypothetical protein